MFRTLRAGRLDSTLTTYQTELEWRAAEAKRRGDSDAWADYVRKALGDAQAALQGQDIDKAWKCFHTARRLEIFGLTEEELVTRAEILRVESTKLNVWRKSAVAKLLGTADAPKPAPTKEEVYQAELILGEHYNNQGYKDAMLRGHVLTLALILGAILLAFLLLFIFGGLPCEKAGQCGDVWMFLSVTLFGLFGGTVSAIITATNTSQTARIPEMVTARRMTLLRLFMGAGSALVIYVFLKSSLSGAFSPEIKTALEHLTPYTIYAICFVAGFSERLVLRVVGYVTGKKEAPGEKGA